MGSVFISTDKQARDAEISLARIDRAISSDEVLKSLAAGLPHVVVEGVRRSLVTERKELGGSLAAYQQAREGYFDLLKERFENEPGTALIIARIVRGFSQKELARRLGLREQAIQRWENEKYRSITLSNYQKVAQVLGVRIRTDDVFDVQGVWAPVYGVSRDEIAKVWRHARTRGWLGINENSEENSMATLVRYVGDHVHRYGTPSLLRTGLNIKEGAYDWTLLAWKAQVTRRAEEIIDQYKPVYEPAEFSWLSDLVKLSRDDDGPLKARSLLLSHGIALVIEPQVPGMPVDGAAFLVDDVPVIGLTLLRDAIDNFWFTLLHEVGHVILHYRTGLTSGFFDDVQERSLDEFEDEANIFAQNLLIPDEIWLRSPVRISKAEQPIEKFAHNIKINPAIIFGRIRKERNDYKIFSNKVGGGTVRRQFTSEFPEH